jgi:hypothetical protein
MTEAPLEGPCSQDLRTEHPRGLRPLDARIRVRRFPITLDRLIERAP